MEELFFETDYVQLHYDSSVPCVTATLLRFMTHEEYKTHLNVGLEFMKEKVKTTGRMMWMPDMRLSQAFTEDDNTWCLVDWTPRALAAGIRHVAFICPENVWAQSSIDDYSDACKEDTKKQQMRIGYFKTENEAKEWFKKLHS